MCCPVALFLGQMTYNLMLYLFCFYYFLQLRNYKFMGLVMVVEAEKISAFRQELKSLINES
jgi:hypothetical protein